MRYNFHIDPCPAPRMVNSDRWKQRPIVSKYFGFRNELRCLANIQGLRELPGKIDMIVFCITMPSSWSKKKKELMKGTPHMVRPDLDNLLKGLIDGICPEDNYIHSIGQLSKIWAMAGSIELRYKSVNIK